MASPLPIPAADAAGGAGGNPYAAAVLAAATVAAVARGDAADGMHLSCPYRCCGA